MMINEYRSGDLEALKERKIIARGNALGQENNVNFFAPRLNIIQGDEFAWGKTNNTCMADKINEENIQYSTINIQCKSKNIEALKGRRAIAQGNALWLNSTTNPIAPRLVVVQGDEIAWGKRNRRK